MRHPINTLILLTTVTCTAGITCVCLADELRFEPRETRWPGNTAEIAIELVGRTPLVQLRINGKGPYLFILDTGASLSALDRPMLRELALAPTKSADVGDGSGSAGRRANVVELDSVELGPARFGGVDAVVMDLGFVVGGDRTVDGLLAFGVFADCLMTVDQPSRRLVLQRGQLAADRGETTIRYRKVHGIPQITTRVADRSVRLTLDTGANGCLTLPGNLASKLPFHNPPVAMGRVQRVTADHDAKLGRIAGELKLARHQIADPLARLTGHSGLLGNQVLQHFAVTFDQRTNRVRFVRDDDAPITIPGVRSRGFFTEHRRGLPVVVEVIADSAAARAGVRVRDRIIEVNNRPIGEVSREEWVSLWNSDQPLSLTVQRRKQTFQATVPMVDLVP